MDNINNSAKSETGSSLKELGNYQLLYEIGRGGMGTVYRARHKILGHEVALKIITGGIFARDDDIKRFIREARVEAKLSHPNIIPLHEFETIPNGGCFYTMSLIDGWDYAKILRDKFFPFQKTAKIIETIARALHYAHSQGVIHRDLKPQNIMIDKNDCPHIMDFGLAKNIRDENIEKLSHTGTIIGTLSYMSPEQTQGENNIIDQRSDIYSLGAILYEALTGKPPFVGNTLFNIIWQITKEDPIPPGQLNPRIPWELEAICLKCLEKSKEKRYKTAENLADDLKSFIGNRPITARPMSITSRAIKFIHRNRVLTGSTAAIIIALTAGLLTTIWQWQSALEAKRLADIARETAEQENYCTSITLAAKKIEEGLYEQVKDLLFKTPPRLRGWEWGVLFCLFPYKIFTCGESFMLYLLGAGKNK